MFALDSTVTVRFMDWLMYLEISASLVSSTSLK